MSTNGYLASLERDEIVCPETGEVSAASELGRAKDLLDTLSFVVSKGRRDINALSRLADEYGFSANFSTDSMLLDVATETLLRVKQVQRRTQDR